MNKFLIPGLALACAAALTAYTAFRGNETPSPSGGSATSASTLPSERLAYRRPQTGVERIPPGPPRDPALAPTEPIVPWDSSALQSWMEATRDAMAAKITDEAVHARANDRTRRQSGGKPAGRYFDVTYDAVDTLFNATNETDRKHAFFILLSTALDGDATAYHNLGNYLSEHPDHEGAEHSAALWRRAADRDFLPSIVNTVDAMARATPPTAPDIQEAYLRYGLDLDAEWGGWHILNFIRNFYAFDYPERPDDGYLMRTAERYRKLGDEKLALTTELQLRVSLERLPADYPRELVLSRRLAALGDVWGMNLAGNAYKNGLGTARDNDLARDYLVACLKVQLNDAYCALSLGALYNQYSRNFVDAPLGAAFYYHAAETSGSADFRNGLRYARGLEAEMSAADKALTQSYLASIRAGDFSALPHVRDARPLPPPPAD